MPGGEAADELEVAEVAGREPVVMPLPVVGEHLERPRADAGDRAQAAPAGHRVGGEEVDAAGRDLGRGAAEREGPGGREVHRGQLGRRREPPLFFEKICQAFVAHDISLSQGVLCAYVSEPIAHQPRGSGDKSLPEIGLDLLSLG